MPKLLGGPRQQGRSDRAASRGLVRGKPQGRALATVPMGNPRNDQANAASACVLPVWRNRQPYTGQGQFSGEIASLA